VCQLTKENMKPRVRYANEIEQSQKEVFDPEVEAVVDHMHKATKLFDIEEVRLLYCSYMRYEPKQPAFYFLFHNKKIVYIGHSSNVWSRLRDHLQQGKEWDRVAVGHCTTAEVARSHEQSFLKNIKVLPKYNRSRTH